MCLKKFLVFCVSFFVAVSNVFGVCSSAEGGNKNLETNQMENITSRNWMKNLSDSALVTDLNIPGTHDSGTGRVTVFTEGYAKCQSKSITEQLNCGIRYLDLRINEKGLINHGGVSCWKSLFKKLYIQDIENYITDFLKSNSSETVILQIKSEGGGNCANIVNKTLVNSSLYYKNNKNIENLTLKDVRGKFVIFSRQSGIRDAYNYYSWDDNVSFDEIWLDSNLGYLQDKYNSSISNKKESIDDFYEKIWKEDEGIPKLIVNFTSFTTAPITLNFLYPSVNDYMSKYVDDNNDKKFGIILMDNPKDSLIEKIYNTNYNRVF